MCQVVNDAWIAGNNRLEERGIYNTGVLCTLRSKPHPDAAQSQHCWYLARPGPCVKAIRRTGTAAPVQYSLGQGAPIGVTLVENSMLGTSNWSRRPQPQLRRHLHRREPCLEAHRRSGTAAPVFHSSGRGKTISGIGGGRRCWGRAIGQEGSTNCSSLTSFSSTDTAHGSSSPI